MLDLLKQFPPACLADAVIDNNLEQIDFFVAQGADVDQARHYDVRLLFWGIQAGHETAVARLLHHGANWQLTTFGKNMMHTAAEAGQIQILQTMAELGASINGCMKYGLERGHLNIVEWLVSKGELLSIREALRSGHAPIARYALQNVSQEKVKTIITDPDTLLTAALLDQDDLIRLLIEFGANPNTRDPHGIHLLQYIFLSSSDFDTEELETLQKLNLEPADWNEPIVQFLVKAGAMLDSN